MSDNNLNDRYETAGKAFADSLSKLPQLTTLDLSNNQFGDGHESVGKAFADSLCKLPQLTYINLAGNQLYNDAKNKHLIKAFAKALSKLPYFKKKYEKKRAVQLQRAADK